MLSLIVLSSCGIDPEKEYNVILDQTVKDLNELQTKIGNLDSYEITTQINNIYSQYDEKVNELQIKLGTNNKKTEILADIMQVFPDIDAYKETVKLLTDKNIEIFKQIQGVKWINDETNNQESIFYMDSKKIAFVNLSKEFNYTITDGNFSFDYGILYFDIANDKLGIKDDFGNTIKYRKAIDKELLLGKWKNPNTYGGRWGGRGIILQNNGKSAEFGNSWDNTTYTVSQGNRIMTTYKLDEYIRNEYYIFDQKLDKMHLSDQHWEIYSWCVGYVRVKSSGPQNLEFIFTGNKEGTEEPLPEINTSKENKGSKDWDAVLDSYEKYVDNYISYVKKVAQGDVSAMTKMASMLEDAEELSDRLDNASDDLSSSQVARYMRITSKLTEAMANL